MISVGLAIAALGLVWQFRQNLNAATIPVPNLALPPPHPSVATPLFSLYNLTEAEIAALADDLYTVKDAISKHFEIARMSTDDTSAGLMNNIARACDQAGIDCPVSYLHPNSPNDEGLASYVLSPEKPPDAAEKLKEAPVKLRRRRRALALSLTLDCPRVQFTTYAGVEKP